VRARPPRLRSSRVVAFDKKQSLYTLTRAIGGQFYQIAPGKAQFCPLQDLDDETDQAWASTYITFLCELNGLQITARRRTEIDQGILRLAKGSTRNRSLTDLQMQIDDLDVKEALHYFTLDSTSGGMLDGRAGDDRIHISRWTVFEMNELYQLDARLINAVLFYLFRRIRRMAHSSTPTLITVDEFREALEHPIAAKEFTGFLQQGRAENIAVLTVMQDLKLVLRSALRSAILSSPTKILGVNGNAASGEEATAYRELDLNEADLQAIASLMPKRQYYWVTPDSKQTISLDCGQVFLAFMASSDEDRPLVDQMMARNPEGWQVDWLRHKGLDSLGWPAFLERVLETEATRYAAVSA
jgi:type IV secretory pathway VirB4 component